MTRRRRPPRPSLIHEQVKLLSDEERMKRFVSLMATALIRVLKEEGRVRTDDHTSA